MILRLICQYTNSEISFCSLVDDESRSWLRFRAQHEVGDVLGNVLHKEHLFLPIGGDELPEGERSLSGYVAYTGKPYRSGNVSKDRFYKTVDEKVNSEL